MKDTTANRGLVTSAREVFRLAAFVWLAVFATDLVHAFKPTLLLSSPVVQMQAVYAALLALAIVLGISALGGLTIWLARVWAYARRRPQHPSEGWGFVRSLSFVLGLSSLLALSRATHQGSAVHLSFAVVMVGLVAIVLCWGRTRRSRPLESLLACGMIGLWLFAMLKPIGGRPEAAAILWLAAAALVANFVARQLRWEAIPRIANTAFGLLAIGLIAHADEGAIDQRTPAQPETLAPGTPNVVLFVVDTLRADHTGIRAYSMDTTPALDAARARQATTFTQAWAGATSTIPSIKSLFTSASPSRWGFKKAGNSAPPRDSWTLPAAMRERGFRTAGFTSNSLLRRQGFRAGFDRFMGVGGMDVLEGSYFLADLLSRHDRFAKWTLATRLAVHKLLGEEIVSWSRDWIGSIEGQPFFLYAHIMDPHWPYHERGYALVPQDVPDSAPLYTYVDFIRDRSLRPVAGDPGLRHMIGRYDEEIRFADDVFASMMRVLEEQGVDRNTIVIFASDHGEAFFERGFYGHGFNVFQEESHVPLVIFWPEDFGSASGSMSARPPPVVSTPVSLLDIAPTLVELFDLARPDRDFAGESLLPLLTGDERDRAPLITEAYTPEFCQAGYREGDRMAWLQFSREIEPRESRAVAVFDLERDPHQRAPIAQTSIEVEAFVERARTALQARWSQWPDRYAAGESEGDYQAGIEEGGLALEQLRVLGYVE